MFVLGWGRVAIPVFATFSAGWISSYGWVCRIFTRNISAKLLRFILGDMQHLPVDIYFHYMYSCFNHQNFERSKCDSTGSIRNYTASVSTPTDFAHSARSLIRDNVALTMMQSARVCLARRSLSSFDPMMVCSIRILGHNWIAAM